MDNKISNLLGKTIVKAEVDGLSSSAKLKLLIQKNKEDIAYNQNLLKETKEKIFNLEEREKNLAKTLSLIDNRDINRTLYDIGWQPERK